MSNMDALEEATSRLLAALEGFEETVLRRLHNGQGIDAMQDRLRSLSAEHERLLQSLETERQRADRLAAANAEVSQRLDTVIDSVKTIIRAN